MSEPGAWMEGALIGNYLLVRQIGRGGMATVYEAVHVELGARVAIKILDRRYSEDPRQVRRFLNEGRAVSQIKHPGVVTITDFAWHESGVAYIVMEYLEGELLSERLSVRGRMPLRDALRVSRQIASALARAHELHIAHRDLKPNNLMLVPDPETIYGERIKIFDFGIAKLPLALPSPLGTVEQPLTQLGTLLGTPAYMSPEQCSEPGAVDPRTDVYALGVMMYQMLAGRLPFSGAPLEVIACHLRQEPIPLRRWAPDVPVAVARLVARMMRKERAERPTMGEVGMELARLGAPDDRRGPAGGDVERSTLNAAASERPAPPRSQLRGAVSLALLLGGGLLLFSLPAGRAPADRASAAAGLAPPVELVPPPADLDLAPPPVGRAPADHASTAADLAPPPADLDLAPPPAQVRTSRRLLSRPVGAEAWREDDGARLGLTPLTLECDPRRRRLMLRLRKHGYREVRLQLDACGGGPRSVELEPTIIDE